MNLADHLRPLLRDHDCVIIPDFGGLVADYTPAQVRPGGRHLLVPPTRQVAFNQALTRNDGLLVDALRQQLGLPAAEAREAVRQAVAALHHELQAQQRTELPGIGVFRQLPGRGLQFEYTGTDNLLPATYGLPELAAHPVRVLDARLAREQQAELVPRLRAVGTQVRWRRLVPGAAVGLLAGVAVATLYLLGLHPEVVPVAWRTHLPRFDVAVTRFAPQQATLAQASFARPVPAPVAQPVAVAAPVVVPAAAPPAATQAPAQTAPAQGAPARAAAGPAGAVARHQSNAAEALLDAPLAMAHPAKLAKVPASGAVALANESNVARPVPLSLRRPAEPGLTTKYPVAPPVTKPIIGPVLLPIMAAKPASAAAKLAAKPTAAKATAATQPLAKPVVVAATAAKPVAVAAPAVAPATAATSATIKSPTGRFYVIVASYTSLAHAEVGRRNLAHAGRPAKVILPLPGSRYYRLSAADFPDRPTAALAANHLRQNPHFDKGLSILPY